MPTPEETAAAALAAAEAAAAAAAKTDPPKTDPPKGDDGKDDPYADLRGKTLTTAQVDALIEKLQNANGEAAANRHRLREMEVANETESAKKVREAKEEGANETSARLTKIIVKQAALGALKDAGASAGFDSLIRLLDPEKLKVNDDGDVTGLPKEIERVKSEFPALFTKGPEPVRRRTVAGSTLDAGAGKGGSEHKSSAQIHADRLLGRS